MAFHGKTGRSQTTVHVLAKGAISVQVVTHPPIAGSEENGPFVGITVIRRSPVGNQDIARRFPGRGLADLDDLHPEIAEQAFAEVVRLSASERR
jgi:hypothetical protein